jgi:hypothetical protein
LTLVVLQTRDWSRSGDAGLLSAAAAPPGLRSLASRPELVLIQQLPVSLYIAHRRQERTCRFAAPRNTTPSIISTVQKAATKPK